ncbi:MAG TPA: hypothetical protein VN829_18150 [Dongiaceae bacterium]|nr:hypothetical protein [Dongiaceae bacterium]
MAKIKNSKDLVLLLLYAPGPKGTPCEPIQGQTRLMKMVFLFEREIARRFNLGGVIDPAAFPKFEAFDYGPYAGQVYADLEFLVNYRFVEVNAGTGSPPSEEERQEFDYWTATSDVDAGIDPRTVGREFCLSERGRRFVEKQGLWVGLSPEQQAALREFKTRCVTASLRSLLRYVYSKYEDMTKKSLIRHEILD